MTTEIQTQQQQGIERQKTQSELAFSDAGKHHKGLAALIDPATSPGMRIVVAYGQALRRNPQIALCTREARDAALYAVAALNLDCSGATGQVWLVPLNETVDGKKVLKLNVWVGVAGMLELARRSGRVLSVQVNSVREGDVFRYVPTDAYTPLYHEPKSGTGRIIATWAQVVMVGGGKETAVIWRDEAEGLVATGRGKKSNGPWYDYPDRMVELAAVRRVLKKAPKSVVPQLTQMGITEAGEVTNYQRPAIGRDAAEVVAETNLLTSEPDAEVSSDNQ